MDKEEGFFRIPYQTVTRDDIRLRLKKDRDELPDSALSDELMQAVADKMGKTLVDDNWWETLELAVEDVCDTLGINFDEDVMCKNCGSYDTSFRSREVHENQSVRKQIDNYYCHVCDGYFQIGDVD